jgi:hypothetical protein
MDRRNQFTAEAARAHPHLDSLLLAIAAEFGRVDIAGCAAALDLIANRIASEVSGADGIELRAEAVARGFARVGFRVADRVSPQDALLPDVLVRRRGHPLMLTAVCTEASRRAGIDARPARACAGYLVGLWEGDRALLVDPAGTHEGPPGSVSWMCAHEVAFLALGELSSLFALHGRLPAAIRASQLRADLPVRGEAREWIGVETAGLQARLN